jgi:bifunctional enzyme CysN/CysC
MALDKSLLRFITCGSVDDGKSSLIGRLLYESKQIFDDQLAAVARDSARHGTTGEDTDLALLVDGLEAEREQGITIDVAYRYFSTPRRAFIVADTPGHEQYTRNMATAASTADLAVLLVDARKGLLPQTKRHTYLCALLGVERIILTVNKMDLVDFDQAVFDRIEADYRAFAAGLGFADITAIPVSARHGDNVCAPSQAMAWRTGPTLLAALENAPAAAGARARPLRFPVQWVNRPDSGFRGFAGTLASGALAVGDTLVVAATGRSSRVARIVTFDADLPSAAAGDAVTLVLDEEIDIRRGDVLCAPQDRPVAADQFAAKLVWMDEAALQPGRSYLLRVGGQQTPAQVTAIKHKIDVETLSERPARTLKLNEIGAVTLHATAPIAFDPYGQNRTTGAFILIDRATNATAGAGMIDFALRRALNIHHQAHAITKPARAAALGQTPRVLWFTGLSGSGKSTIADKVERALHAQGRHTMLLDGDNIRHGLNKDLGFTENDRVENIRRIGHVAELMTQAGLIVICSFISPYAAERALVREMLGEGEFLEIFVDTPLAECERRDPKGLYAKARAGLIKNFTGIDAPYEAPLAPELRIDGMALDADAAAEAVLALLAQAERG